MCERECSYLFHFSDAVVILKFYPRSPKLAEKCLEQGRKPTVSLKKSPR